MGAMARIVISQQFATPAPEVWKRLADLGSHVEWMRDARSLEFVTDQRSGVGTVMRVETRVGPFTTVDVLEVTGWVEGSSITVAHRGAVTGEATISVRLEGDGSLVTWVEELVFPWWLGSRLGAWLARPALASLWRGNLARLEASMG
jgi:hypothetical protein